MARKRDSRGWFMTDADIARERGKVGLGILIGLALAYVFIYGV